MDLYRYRRIDSAIREIENSTFHFASVEELNDPLEGYVCLYWQGDRPAWEGLFRNYICSCFYSIEAYLLARDEKILWERTLLPDIHAFDAYPIGESYKRIGDLIWEDDDIIRIASEYGNNRIICSEDELHYVLQFIHGRVLRLCLLRLKEKELISADEVDALISSVTIGNLSAIPYENREDLEKENLRGVVARATDSTLRDMIELKMLEFGLKEEGFSYGKTIEEGDDDSAKRGRQHRNWIAIVVDYPMMYINQLKNMIYPEAFFVCFSGKNDDSVMWGNYADSHQGVCLIYDVEECDINNKNRGYFDPLKKHIVPRKMEYGGEIIKRNFFESLGRLTVSQVKTWLSGKNNCVSELYKTYYDKEHVNEWRDEYWTAFGAKNYRKLENWSYEDEYRIHIDNTFYEYEKDESKLNPNGWKRSRDLKYDLHSLKGVIFGIRTTEYDKVMILKAFLEKGIADDIEYYQAVYNEENQRIEVRRKTFWGKPKIYDDSYRCEER